MAEAAVAAEGAVGAANEDGQGGEMEDIAEVGLLLRAQLSYLMADSRLPAACSEGEAAGDLGGDAEQVDGGWRERGGKGMRGEEGAVGAFSSDLATKLEELLESLCGRGGAAEWQQVVRAAAQRMVCVVVPAAVIGYLSALQRSLHTVSPAGDVARVGAGGVEPEEGVESRRLDGGRGEPGKDREERGDADEVGTGECVWSVAIAVLAPYVVEVMKGDVTPAGKGLKMEDMSQPGLRERCLARLVQASVSFVLQWWSGMVGFEGWGGKQPLCVKKGRTVLPPYGHRIPPYTTIFGVVRIL